MKKRTINGIVTVIVLSILFYLVIVALTGADAVASAMANLDFTYLPVILGLVFAAYLIRGFRWNYYLREIGVKVGHKEGQWLYFSGLSMLITPMMLSGAIKVGLVKARHGEPISSSFPIVIVERLTDLIGMLVLIVVAGFALAFFSMKPYYFGMTLFVVCFLVVTVAIMRNRTICEGFISWLGKGGTRKRLQESLANAYGTIYSLLGPKALLVASTIGFASWAVQWLAFYLVLLGVGIELGALETMFIFAFPSVVGVISQLPGGIGAEEGGMLALMVMAGEASAISVAAILLYRILTLWFGLLMGVIALKYYTRKYIGTGAHPRRRGRRTLRAIRRLRRSTRATFRKACWRRAGRTDSRNTPKTGKTVEP